MLDKLEELDLPASNLIQLLGLFQRFSSVPATFMLVAFKFFCVLSLSDVVSLLWFPEHQYN